MTENEYNQGMSDRTRYLLAAILICSALLLGVVAPVDAATSVVFRTYGLPAPSDVDVGSPTEIVVDYQITPVGGTLSSGSTSFGFPGPSRTVPWSSGATCSFEFHDCTVRIDSIDKTYYCLETSLAVLSTGNAVVTGKYIVAETTIAPPTNIAPDVTIDDCITAINEGDTFTGSGSFTDSDADTWTAAVDYGDGTGEQELELTDKSFKLSKTYKDNGEYNVIVSVDDGENTDTSTINLKVNNVAPTVGAISEPLNPVKAITQFTAKATFSDPSVLDAPYTAVWNWGDGTPSSEDTITEPSGSGSVSGSHSYSSPGIYTISVTVTDKDGGQSIPVRNTIVVYDPSAGFVTGGGWFISPAGAYVTDPAMTGKGHFAFVSRYKKDETVPGSSAKFQLKADGLDFESTSSEWLVIMGAKAMYKGAGTLNGAGNYEFLLSAIDGSTDRIRIKIWDSVSGDVVYDNLAGMPDGADPTTGTSGGNIVVHS